MSSPSDAQTVVSALPPGCIPRPRLVDALTVASNHALTLIAAAPGSGKTVLLSQWALAQPSAPAWVSLGPGDNDPARFWPLVAAAFRVAGVAPAMGRLDEALSTAVDANMRVVEPYLVSLADGFPPVYLVLDDAHLLTHPTVLDGLDSLLRGNWPRLHLILAARTDPLLPLHRYRLAGQMSELRARDLAMTEGEARALLLAHHVTLSPREFNVLRARTEGWVAGLQLSAMSMEGAEHPDEFVTEFALAEGSAGEYLMNEILDRQADRVRTLLIETSFLPEVDAELAEAVTGYSGAAEALSELSRKNAFVLPLDRMSQRFRYHQLFREVLRYLLRREPLQRRHELSDRASRWYQERGQFAEALRVAVDGQDWSRVADMLVHGGFAQAFINHADLSFVRPTDLVAYDGVDTSELALARGALLAAAGRPVAARQELDEARRAGAPADRAASLTVALVELIIARSEHRTGDLDSLASAVAAHSGDDDALAALPAAVLLEQGSAQFWAGYYDTTESLLNDAVEQAGRAGNVPLELRCVAQLTLANAYWGRFRTSLEDEARANRLLRRQPRLLTPTALHLALSIRAYHRADFETAFRSLSDAEVTLNAEHDADLPAAVPTMRGVLLATLGQVGPAQEQLAVSHAAPGGITEDSRVTALADIETTLGLPEAALTRLRAHATSSPSAATSLAASRALLALGELRKAGDTLRPVLAGADSYTPRSLVVEGLIARARVADAAGQEDVAVESLIRACELASGEIAYPFIKATDDFRGLLARHWSLAALWPHHAGQPVVVEPRKVDARLPEGTLPVPLTDRERTVLGWLSTRMSTTEIADELGVSINTVKTHIASIYRKLAALHRRDAVSRARSLELI